MMPIEPRILSGWVWAAVTAALMAAAGAAGWRYSANEGAAKLAACNADRQAERAAAAEAAARLIARAQDAEADAARRLAEIEAASNRKVMETRREIYALTTGRECLSGAVRLRLNAAIDAADDMPQGAGAADATNAAPADDTAVALWIADAARQYDACRARIDAIRQWDEVTNGR